MDDFTDEYEEESNTEEDEESDTEEEEESDTENETEANVEEESTTETDEKESNISTENEEENTISEETDEEDYTISTEDILPTTSYNFQQAKNPITDVTNVSMFKANSRIGPNKHSKFSLYIYKKLQLISLFCHVL